MKLRLLILFSLVWLFIPAAFAQTGMKLSIIGIEGDVLKNAETQILSLKDAYGPNLSNAELDEFCTLAPKKIQKALEPYGYFKSTVSVKRKWEKGHPVLTFKVHKGPILRLRHVNLRLEGPGQNNPHLLKTLQEFALTPGQRFNVETYEEAKETLFQAANQEGYLKAELTTKTIQIDLKAYYADITLTLSTGPIYYFGLVSFSDSPYAQEFLESFITFHDTEPFSSQKLVAFQQDLANSGYFKQVVVTPDIKNANYYHVPIHITVTPKKSQQYNFGIGYGTFTGPRLSAGVDFRRVTNTGQHFNALVKYSSVLKGLAAKYYIPGRHPMTDRYTLGVNFQEFLPKNGKSISKTFSAGYERKIHAWRYNVSLNYLSELYRNEIVSDTSRFSGILYPNLTINRMEADDLMWPKFGNSITLSLQGSSRYILSTTSFLQSEIKGKYIISPLESGRVILRGELGYTVVRDLKRLPLTLNFFAGGLDSVRGYPYSGIGPGRYLEVGSVEYQHTIKGNWSAAIFYDMGTATDHFNSKMNTSEGLGIIYHSVIGPIRLYLAHANDVPPGKRLDIEFSIGPDL